MADIGSWNGHEFTVSPALIRGFTGLTVKGSLTAKDKTADNQKYVARKAGNPVEVGMTIGLYAATGCNVRDEAMQLVAEATQGATNYFYLNGKKLIPSQLLLVQADVEQTQIAPNGTWVMCMVNIVLKQADKGDGSGAASSGSQKKSVKTTQPAASAGGEANIPDEIAQKKAQNAAQADIARIINNAKQATVSTLKTANVSRYTKGNTMQTR